MRRCEFCETPLPEGKRASARYCDDVCRRAHWAERTGYRTGAAGNGRERLRAASPRRRSGLQVSYRKAVAAVMSMFVAHTGEVMTRSDARQLVESALADALSPAQRARLEERS